jgi:hypothetical protein
MPKETDETTASTPPQEPTRKASAFQVTQEPVTAGDHEEDAHKYEAASGTTAAQSPHVSAPAFEDLGALPSTYDEDTLFLIARDPRWLFSYWDFNWLRYPAANMRYGYAQFFLKITRADGGQEALVEVNPEARNWYVPVNHPDTMYFSEIGYFDQEGAWRGIVKSAPAHTPADALAPETESANFATVPSPASRGKAASNSAAAKPQAGANSSGGS